MSTRITLQTSWPFVSRSRNTTICKSSSTPIQDHCWIQSLSNPAAARSLFHTPPALPPACSVNLHTSPSSPCPNASLSLSTSFGQPGSHHSHHPTRPFPSLCSSNGASTRTNKLAASSVPWEMIDNTPPSTKISFLHPLSPLAPPLPHPELVGNSDSSRLGGEPARFST